MTGKMKRFDTHKKGTNSRSTAYRVELRETLLILKPKREPSEWTVPLPSMQSVRQLACEWCMDCCI